MADTREVVIKIVNADTQKKATDSFTESSQTNGTQQPESKSNSTAKRLAAYAGSQAIGKIKNLASYDYSKYTQLTENYVAQNSMAIANSLIGNTTSLVSSVGTGFAIGGVIGAVVGAVVGTVSIGVNAFQTYSNAFQELDIKAYDKYYQGARMGLIDGNRGTEN